jgi:ParB-like nuclease domain
MEVEMSLTEANQNALSIVYQALADLKPRATNPRTHSKKQIAQIANAIRRFGFTNPVLVDDTNGIVAGHGRVEAAKAVGLDQVPTVRLSYCRRAPFLRTVLPLPLAPLAISHNGSTLTSTAKLIDWRPRVEQSH